MLECGGIDRECTQLLESRLGVPVDLLKCLCVDIPLLVEIGHRRYPIRFTLDGKRLLRSLWVALVETEKEPSLFPIYNVSPLTLTKLLLAVDI